MRRSHHKKRDTEMLVVHKPTEPVADGEEGTEGRANPDDLAWLRGSVSAARDRSERTAAMAEIQERYGNDAAQDAVRGARYDAGDGEGEEA